MARKNLFGLTPPAPETPATTASPNDRPLAGMKIPPKASGPVGAISQSLEAMSARAQRADEIEKKLSAGQVIVELSADLIDGSFINDRMGMDAEKLAELKVQIQEHGQQVPILVRPHPMNPDRYQVAYGHRRLAVAKELGIPVRAVIRDLSNDQLVISQGQENNARTDLSYIEKCHFAWNLETNDFSRETIIAALNVDKAALSRMISLVLRLPEGLIDAVGAAPSTGRKRWNELADMLHNPAQHAKAKKIIKEVGFADLHSDDRFTRLYEGLKKPVNNSGSKVRAFRTGNVTVQISETDKKLSLAFDKRSEPGFASYVEAQLERLLSEYNSSRTETDSGE